MKKKEKKRKQTVDAIKKYYFPHSVTYPGTARSYTVLKIGNCTE